MLLSIALLGWPLAGSDYRHADLVEAAGKLALRIEGRANVGTFSTQDRVSLDALPDGRFALAWESRRQRQGLPGVYKRAFDQNGRPLSLESGTTADKGSPQLDASIALAPDGSARVAYLSRYRDGRHTPAYLGDLLLDSGKGLQAEPLIAAGADGQWVAAWAGEVGHLETRIFAQLFGKDGKPLGPSFRVSGADRLETLPSLTAGEKGFALAWQTFDSKRKPAGLKGRAFDWSGAASSPVRALGAKAGIEPSLEACGEGWILGWVEPKAKGSFRVAAQRLNPGLEANGRAIRVAPQPDDQNAVAVAGRSDGSFALAWNHRTEQDSDVYAQLFDAKAKPLGKAFRITRTSTGRQAMREASGTRRLALFDQGLAVAWDGDGGLGDASGAHFTLLRFDEAATQALCARINASATKPPPKSVADGEPQLKFDRVITAQAGSHEPPISNFKKIVNPWDVPIQAVGGGFNAYSQTSFTPPDCSIAVGPQHIVVVVNDGIAFYTKGGALTYMNNQRLTNGFWGQLAASDNFIYDPECFYDTLTGRFFVMATQGAQTTQNSAALVGISDDSDPNGTWHLYKFNTTGLAGNFFDSPNFGTDANVLYITGDGFGLGSNYPVYCIEKAPLLSGLPPGIIRSAVMPTSTQSAGIPPVQDSGPRYYMVEHKEAGTNTAIDLTALANPLTTGPSFQRFTLAVASYGPPGDPPQSGSSSRVNTFDQRFWSVEFRNGHIWATHHINGRTLARWYEIDPRGWPTSGNTPILVQSGNVDINASTYTFFSAIAVDEGNNAAVAYGRGSSAEFYSAAHSYRRMADPPGTIGNHTIDRTATGPYTSGRWGDYHGCEVDPAYPGLMWSFAEWAEGNSWRAWVQPFYVTDALWPVSVQIVRGILLGGVRTDLIYDDGRAVTVRSGITQANTRPVVEVQLQTATRRDGAAAQLQFAYSVTMSGLQLTTSLLNQTTGQFDVVDVRAASTSHQSVAFGVPNFENYVRASDGAVVCRMHVTTVAPVTSSAVILRLDRWAWVEN